MKNSPQRHSFKKDFLVIAHRGASRYAPENTMAAFTLAHRMEADMIELDVQLSTDGIPVVFHDAKLDRHTNCRGFVSSFHFSELQQLDAGKWFSIKFMGEKIPSLQEVLHWAAGKIMLNIEIKPEAIDNTDESGIERKVLQLVEEANMEKDIIISSFNYRCIERIKKINADVLTGLLYNKQMSGKRNPVELLNDYNADFFHCSKSEMGYKWRKQLKDAGKKYLIYTVNRRKPMRKWIENGAYGIFSDKPDTLKAVAGDFFKENA